ncbi:MAG: TonB-dependent receptor [Caulobacteraceae bacterium]
MAEVVVTGSRIARRDFTESSPVVSVNQQSLENRSTPELERTLSQLPQFAQGNNQFTPTIAQQINATTTPGASTLNLRGLGANRNLVLLDGRRAQPANASLAIDINSIPASAIEGVEIISGGASAVYGADAVAGVVNFKLKKNFQGLELDAQYGITQEGDNKTPNVSILMGGNFADGKGNAMVGAGYTSRSVVYQKDRDFYAAPWSDRTTNSATSPLWLPQAGYDCGGSVQFVGLAPFANCPSPAALNAIFGPGVVPTFGPEIQVNYNGTVFYPRRGLNGQGAPRYAGSLAPDYKVDQNGQLGFSDTGAQLSPTMTRWSMLGSSHYEITPHVTAFLQGTFTESTVRLRGGYSPAVQFWATAIPHDAAHPTTPELEALLNSRPNPGAPWALSMLTTNLVGAPLSTNTSNTYQVLAGLKGDVPGTDWTWEAYGSHGDTSYSAITSSGVFSVQRLRQVLASPNYGAGQTFSLPSLQTSHCSSGFYNAIFKGQPASADCIEAITTKQQNSQRLTQDIVEATIQGGLLNLPAGQLRFAAGLDYRENRFVFNADPLSEVTSFADTTSFFPTSSTKGAINAKEVYGELLVPVLKDLPLIKSFNLELGGRYSDYSTSGGGVTYKALGDWALNDYIRFRGGFQRAQRAPNVAELFQPGTPNVVLAAAGDPCAVSTPVSWGNNASNPKLAQTRALCAALIKRNDPNFVYDGATYAGPFGGFFPVTIDMQTGSPTVKPEKANTFTAGVVLRSPFSEPLLSRATLSIDWYDIKITDAIQVATSETLYEQCFNADGQSNPTLSITGNKFCDNIIREAGTGANRIATAPYYNSGSLHTRGLDVQFDWSTPAPGMFGAPGAFSLNTVFNYLLKYETQSAKGATIYDSAGTVVIGAPGSNFRYRAVTSANYSAGPASVGVRWRYFPSAKNQNTVVNAATNTLEGVDAHNEVDLFARWTLNRTLELRFGVDNVFNSQPELLGRNVSATQPNSNLGQTLSDYDLLGRRFYAGVKARF